MTPLAIIGWTDWDETTQSWVKYEETVTTFPELEKRMEELRGQGQSPRYDWSEEWKRINRKGYA